MLRKVRYVRQFWLIEWKYDEKQGKIKLIFKNNKLFCFNSNYIDVDELSWMEISNQIIILCVQ